MKKVYVVVYGWNRKDDYDTIEWSVDKVFSTNQKAVEYIKSEIGNVPLKDGRYEWSDKIDGSGETDYIYLIDEHDLE